MRSRAVSRGAPFRAFTLIEILVVVIILGILAAIVFVLAGTSVRDTKQQSFVTSLKTFAEAAHVYYVKVGDYVPDGSTGQTPPGFEDYIDEKAFELPTPIGGSWDTEKNDNGVTSAVGVHFNGAETQDDAYMTQIDAIFDDGDLATGAFRKLAQNRYYYVIAD